MAARFEAPPGPRRRPGGRPVSVDAILEALRDLDKFARDAGRTAQVEGSNHGAPPVGDATPIDRGLPAAAAMIPRNSASY
jgi:hypothetical protein